MTAELAHPRPTTEIPAAPARTVPGTVTDLRSRRPAHPRPRAAATGTSARPIPDPETTERFIAWLVRAVHEVAAGSRPYPQLEPWLAPTIARRLAAQLRSTRPRPTAAVTIHHVRVAPPTPSGALEATAVIEHGERVRALAIRLERHRDRWRATELTAPEWGYAPLPTASVAAPSDEPDAFDEAAAEAAARDRLDLAAACTRPTGEAPSDATTASDDAVVLALSPRRDTA